MRTTRLKVHECPVCHYSVDAASGLANDEKPRPNNFGLCVNCGAINVYDDDMQLRRASDAEETALLASGMGPKVLWAQAEIRKRGRIPGVERRRKKNPP